MSNSRDEHSTSSSARPVTIEDLSEAYQKPEGDYSFLEFDVPSWMHVYNTSRQFELDGKHLLLGRAERRDNQLSSQVVPFKLKRNGTWVEDRTVSNLNQLTAGRIMQDPQIAYIQGHWVVNCIEVLPNDVNDNQAGCAYWTNVYSGERLDELRQLTKSPMQMKCVRFIELANGQVGVFTRPQSPGNPQRGGLGKIGFCVVDSLDDIDTSVMSEAPIIYDLFSNEEWGGVNDVQLMPDGRLLALGHIARYLKNSPIKGDREYHSIIFEFDPFRRRIDKLKMVSRVVDMGLESLDLKVKPKEEYLSKVEYPSSLHPGSNLQADDFIVLLKSVRDSVQVMQSIPNPVLT